MRMTRTSISIFLSILFISLLGGQADAHISHHPHRSHHSSHFYSGRPSAWCGWYMRTLKGGGPEFNLARNWATRGTASQAAVGRIVVWPHHVGIITGYDSQRHLWIVKSGNDGHAVRERPRPITGAIAIRNLS